MVVVVLLGDGEFWVKGDPWLVVLGGFVGCNDAATDDDGNGGRRGYAMARTTWSYGCVMLVTYTVEL